MTLHKRPIVTRTQTSVTLKILQILVQPQHMMYYHNSREILTDVVTFYCHNCQSVPPWAQVHLNKFSNSYETCYESDKPQISYSSATITSALLMKHGHPINILIPMCQVQILPNLFVLHICLLVRNLNTCCEGFINPS